ncbi:MAG: hypothetical protein ACE5Z5_00560 [Candidatus Bathyarchaeia archaeon]
MRSATTRLDCFNPRVSVVAGIDTGPVVSFRVVAVSYLLVFVIV